MSDLVNVQSFEEMLDESFRPLCSGEIMRGTVVRVTPTEVIVDLGFKSDGIVARSEFSENQTTELTELVKPGDVIDVWVLRVNDGEGNVVCSKRKVESQAGIKNIEAAFHDKTVLRGKVTDVVKGGLTVNIQGIRAFVPSSQISNRFIKELEEFKGKELDFEILEFDRSKRLRIIAGRRGLAAREAEERHNAIFGNMEVGQTMEGTVSRIVNFGAFIDLGGVDGLVHITELSWKRVSKVTDVLNVGDKVNAIVKDFHPESGKISLSLKDAKDNPWAGILDKYPVGAIVKGTVVRFATFGAFVNLDDGIDGLIHISKIADKRVAKPADELEIGQVIDVQIVSVDIDNKKISLSKRDADAILNPPPEPGDENYEDGVVDVAAYIAENEEPTAEDPAAPAPEEEPVAEEVVIEEPVLEEPVAEEAAPAEEPAAEEPAQVVEIPAEEAVDTETEAE